MLSPAPVPLAELAAARLSDYNIVELSELATGVIFACYRMRRLGQYGMTLAADGGGIEQLNLSVTEKGIEYKVLG